MRHRSRFQRIHVFWHIFLCDNVASINKCISMPSAPIIEGCDKIILTKIFDTPLINVKYYFGFQFSFSAAARARRVNNRSIHFALRDTAVASDGHHPDSGRVGTELQLLGGPLRWVRGSGNAHLQLQRVAAGAVRLAACARPRLHSQLARLPHDHLDELRLRRGRLHRLRRLPHQQTHPWNRWAALQDFRRNAKFTIHSHSVARLSTLPPYDGKMIIEFLSNLIFEARSDLQLF